MRHFYKFHSTHFKYHPEIDLSITIKANCWNIPPSSTIVDSIDCIVSARLERNDSYITTEYTRIKIHVGTLIYSSNFIY